MTRKHSRPPIYLTRDGARAPLAVQRTAVVFSQDDAIFTLIADGLGNGWRLDRCAEAGRARASLVQAGVGIVVIDDGAIEEGTRGWLLDQVRKWAPNALVVYIASNHSPEIERQARAHSVQYYASQPIDRERTVRILHSFVAAVR